VELIHVHKDYNYYENKNDIAIVLLEKAFRMTSHVNKISLPQPNEEFTSITSWKIWPEIYYNVFRKVKIPIIPNEKCRRVYAKGWDLVTDEMMCAGDKSPGSDGGPVACERKNGSSVLCGIIVDSQGLEGPQYPVMHTKVSYYVDWIKTSIRNIQSMKE